MVIDPSALERQNMYKLLIGSVVPRPIAWVSTISPGGRPNLAPFSYFNIACANPPTLLFCPNRRADGSKKDTLLNIEATGEYVIHIVDEARVEQMNRTSAEFPPEVDEFEQAGLTPSPSRRVRPARVAEAPIAFECRLFQIVPVGDAPSGGDVVIGRVLLVHIRDDVRPDTDVDLRALRPVARLAGSGYARITDTFDLPRPIYKPPDNS
jgi:flavin reductase (DIM6/NTAB) family NADH-FMN oxidoreductase RutF